MMAFTMIFSLMKAPTVNAVETLEIEGTQVV